MKISLSITLLSCLLTNRPVGLLAQANSAPMARAIATANLAVHHRRNSRFVEAEKYFRITYQLRCEALGRDHTDTAIALNNLADLETTLGRYEEAEQDFRQALSARNLTSIDRIAIRNNLGNLMRMQGRFAEAQRQFNENPRDAIGLNNLARLAEDQNQFNQAVQLYQAALAISPTCAIQANLGRLHLRLGNLGKARSFLESALAQQPTDAERIVMLQSMAELLLAENRVVDSVATFRSALELRQQVFGVTHPGLVPLLTDFAAALRQYGQSKKAKELEARARKLSVQMEQSRPNVHWRTLR